MNRYRVTCTRPATVERFYADIDAQDPHEALVKAQALARRGPECIHVFTDRLPDQQWKAGVIQHIGEDLGL